MFIVAIVANVLQAFGTLYKLLAHHALVAPALQTLLVEAVIVRHSTSLTCFPINSNMGVLKSLMTRFLRIRNIKLLDRSVHYIQTISIDKGVKRFRLVDMITHVSRVWLDQVLY